MTRPLLPDRAGSASGSASGSVSDLSTVPDERLEAELCQLAADIAAGTARWFKLIAEYDRRQIWASWECRSMAHFLSGHVGVSLITARQYVNVARVLQQFPVLAAEFDAGRLSYSRVRAVCRVVTPESEVDLVNMALHATAPQLERFVSNVERAARSDDVDDEAQQHERRELVIVTQDDGTVIVRGRFSAEVGTALRRAVEFEVQRSISQDRAEMATRVEGPVEMTGVELAGVEMPFGQLRADALIRLVEAGHVALSQPSAAGSRDLGHLKASSPARSGGEPGQGQQPDLRHDAAASLRPLVVIHRHPDGDELESGPPISRARAGRLSAGADVVIATHHSRTSRRSPGSKSGSGEDSKSVVDERITYQRLHPRVPTASQRRALAERDQGCRFPGCGTRGSLHAHHIHEYRNGGLTITLNLILLCSMHHHAVHRNRWRISGLPQGKLTFTRPGLSASVLRDGDIESIIDHFTGPIAPQMRGERFDINLAVEAFLHNQTIPRSNNHQTRSPLAPGSPLPSEDP